MARILFFALIAAIIYWIVRRAAAPQNRRADPSGPAAGAPMLQCAFCGVHFPANEARFGADGRSFCGEAHQQAAFHAGTK